MFKFNILILSTLLCLNTSIFAQNANQHVSYIELTQSEYIDIDPDKITISINLKESDDNKISVDKLEKDMLAVLTSIGIDTQTALKVSDLSSEFEKRTFFGNKTNLSKRYELVVGDAKTATIVMLALKEKKISNIYIANVENTQIEDYRKQCSINALKKAKVQAQEMAKSLGQEVGKAFYIKENHYYPSTRGNVMMSKSFDYAIYDDEEAISEIADIDFEKLRVESSVIVKFYLY